jgi:hypothetical protein
VLTVHGSPQRIKLGAGFRPPRANEASARQRQDAKGFTRPYPTPARHSTVRTATARPAPDSAQRPSKTRARVFLAERRAGTRRSWRGRDALRPRNRGRRTARRGRARNRRARQLPHRQQVPVIVLSATDEWREARRGARARAPSCASPKTCTRSQRLARAFSREGPSSFSKGGLGSISGRKARTFPSRRVARLSGRGRAPAGGLLGGAPRPHLIRPKLL